jgi:hypothetical protein
VSHPTPTPVANSPSGSAIGTILIDLNGDGKLDLVTCNPGSNSVSVQLGNGDGTFQAASTYTVAAYPVAVAAGDINGDGKLDLVVACESAGQISVLAGNGDGTFAPAVNYAVGINPNESYYPNAIALADLNSDGKVDAIVTDDNGPDSEVDVLFGNGNGSFQTAQSYYLDYSPKAVSVADVTGDGLSDIIVTTSDYLNVLTNEGNGSFSPAAYDLPYYDLRGFATGDLKNNGQVDVIVANQGDGTIGQGDDGGISIFFNGNFSSPSNYTVAGAYSVTVADVNEDGNPDLIVGTIYGTDYILLGNGDGTFQPSQPITGGPKISAGDLNGDGIPDLVFSGHNNVTVSLGQSYQTISGNIFADLNRNHVQDAGELNLEGWLVYADLNKNGKQDPGEPYTVSDVSGNYTLTGVPFGASIYITDVAPHDTTSTQTIWSPNINTPTEGTFTSDLNTSTISSDPTSFAVLNGAAYISAYGNNGYGIYKYDTSGNLTFVTAAPSAASSMTTFGSAIYYNAYDPASNSMALFKFDGTNAPTVVPGTTNVGSSGPVGLTVYNSTLYFFAYDGPNSSTALFQYTGAGSASVVSDFYSGAISGSVKTAVYAGNLYFISPNGTLYKYTGSGSPVLVTGSPSGLASLAVFSPASGTYLMLGTTTLGLGLWKFNGSTFTNVYALRGTGVSGLVAVGAGASARLIAFRGSRIYQYDGTSVTLPAVATFSSVGSTAFVYNNLLYLEISQSINSQTAYSLITWNPVSLVETAVQGPSATLDSTYSYHQFLSFNGQLLFAGADSNGDIELWGTTGSASASELVNINTTPASSAPGQGVSFNGSIYYIANDAAHGLALFKFDGTTQTYIAGTANLDPTGLAVYNNALYFYSENSSAGLFKWDGTALTSLGAYGTTGPLQSVILNNVLYSGGAGNGDLIGFSGGSESSLIYTYNNPSDLTVFDGAIYYNGSDLTAGSYSLYKSGGVTTPLLIAGTTGTNPSNLTVLGYSLYFVGSDGQGNQEIWQYNGTTASLLTSIASGFSNAQSITSCNGAIYYTISKGGLNYLYKYDGTTTTPVTSTSGPAPTNFIAFNNVLYFTMNGNIYGYDGATLAQQTYSTSNVWSWVGPVGTSLAYQGSDATHGYELWTWTPEKFANTIATGVGPGGSEGGQNLGNTPTLQLNAGGPNSVLIASGGALPEGTPITFKASYHSPSGSTGYTIQWYVNGSAVSGQNGTSFVFTAPDTGSYLAQVTVTDGSTITSASRTITSTDVPPTVSITNAPATASQYVPITLNSNITSSVPANLTGIQYFWSVTANGAPVTLPVGTITNAASFTFSPNDGSPTGMPFVVTLQITDKNGDTSTASVTINVTNAAPVATLQSPTGPVYVGSPVSVGVSALDGLTALAAGLNYTWTVTKVHGSITTPNFATGIISSAVGPASITFTPDDDGIYTVSVVATDNLGLSSAAATLAINVTPLVMVNGLPSGSITDQTPVSLIAGAADPGGGLSYTWSVVKNHGTTVTNNWQSGTGQLVNFTPDDSGTYVITFIATDSQGISGSSTSTINVTHADPVLTLSGLPTTSIPELSAVPFSSQVTESAGELSSLTYAWHVDKVNSDGTVILQANWASGTTATGNFTPDDPGTYELTVTTTDADGASATQTALITAVASGPAVTVQGAPTSAVPEGTAIALTSSVMDGLTVSSSGYSYLWTVTDNGAVVPLTGVTLTQPTLSFAAPEAGSFVASLKVTDSASLSGTGAGSFTISNVAPTVSLGAAPTVAKGSLVQFSNAFTDPGTLDSFTYLWHVVSNNGVSISDATTQNFSFTPSNTGKYTVTYTVTDNFGGIGTGSVVVNVPNLAPTTTGFTSSGTLSVGKSVTFTLAGALDPFTHTSAGLTYSFDYKDDGSFSETGDVSGAATAAASHIFGLPGTYTVHGRVTDTEGGYADFYKTVTIKNVPPTIPITPLTSALTPATTTSVAEGSTFTIGLANSYAGTSTLENYSVAWGDGQTSTIQSTASTATHIYAGAGSYVIKVTATDNYGTWPATYSIPNGSGGSISVATGLPVTVTDVAPSFPSGSLGATANLYVNQSLNRTGTFVDPGIGPWSVLVNYGDGSAPVTLANLTTTSLPLYHLYTAANTYTVSVTATDRNGLSGNSTLLVNVTPAANVVPVIGAVTASPNPINIGWSLTLTATGVTAAGSTVNGISFYADPLGSSSTTGGTLLGTATSGTNGSWTLSGISTTGLSAGTYIYYAIATDAASVSSAAVATQVVLVVGPPPALSYYLRLDADGQHVDVWNNNTGTGTIAQQVLRTQSTALTLTTNGGVGSFTVDNSAGNVFITGGLTLAGDASTALKIIGSGNGDSITANASQIVFNGNTINFSGVTTETLDPHGGTDALTVSAGKLMMVAAPAGGGILKRSFSSITIGAGGDLQVLTAASHSDRAVLVVGSLSIAGSTNSWTGLLDLGGNDMDLQTGSLATLSNQAAAGYNYRGASNWQPQGISSSTALADSTHLTALGVIKNNQSGTALYGTGGTFALFDTVSPGAGDYLIKSTYFGDARLTGKIDSTDYTKIDNGFLGHLTGWLNGDFNYDGVVNGSDYTLIDNAFNTQGASLAAEIAAKSQVDQPAPAAAASVVIAQAPSTVKITSSTSVVYTGKARKPRVAVTGSTGAVSYTYYAGTGTSGTNLGNASPLNAGTYTVVASVAADDHYAAASSDPLTFTITPAGSTIVVTSASSMVHNGKPYRPTVSVTGSTGAIRYAYFAGKGIRGTKLGKTAPLNVGTYTVVALVAATGNYAAAASSPFSFSIT